jgi:hypothetical protein
VRRERHRARKYQQLVAIQQKPPGKTDLLFLLRSRKPVSFGIILTTKLSYTLIQLPLRIADFVGKLEADLGLVFWWPVLS